MEQREEIARAQKPPALTAEELALTPEDFLLPDLRVPEQSFRYVPYRPRVQRWNAQMVRSVLDRAAADRHRYHRIDQRPGHAAVFLKSTLMLRQGGERMRRESLFVLLALAVSALVSCATTAQPRVVTVELFDSSAAIEAPQACPGTAALPLMLPLFPEPVAMTVTAREVSLPEPAGSPKAETKDPAPSVVPPQAPVPEAPFDSGFDTPIRPRARPAFPFAEPIAPPAGQPQKATSSATAAARQHPRPGKESGGCGGCCGDRGQHDCRHSEDRGQRGCRHRRAVGR